ncbi:MAG: hypothetical protein RL660_1165 [Bacteroidota bacterium]|jgi:hypothetical protein
MARFLILILVLNIQLCIGQTRLQDSLYAQFKTDVAVQTKGNGPLVMFDNDTKLSFCQLVKFSSIEQLIAYCDDSSAYIRSVMFCALVEKDTIGSSASRVFEKYKNDSTSFLTQSGCMVTSWKMNEFMRFAIGSHDTIKRPSIDEQLNTLLHGLPSIKFNNNCAKHNLLTRSCVKASDSLELTGMPFCKIASFAIVLQYNHEEEIRIASKGNRFSKQMKKAMLRMQPESAIYFSDVVILTPDNKMRTLGDFKFTVVE